MFWEIKGNSNFFISQRKRNFLENPKCFSPSVKNKEWHITGERFYSITPYCFFFSFFGKILNSRNVYNWQLFETKQTPSKFFRLRWEELKGILPNFFVRGVRQEKNPRNVHNWRPFESFETCSHEANLQFQVLCFYFREIFSKNFSACGGPKSLDSTGEPPPSPNPPKKIALPKKCITSRKTAFSNRQKNVHIWQHFGEKN